MTLRNRILNLDTKHAGPARVWLDGVWEGNGSSDPTLDEGGAGLTVVRDGATGQYKITLDGVGNMKVTSFNVQALSSAHRHTLVEARSLSNRTITVQITDTSNTAQDLAAGEFLSVQVGAKYMGVRDH